MVLMTVAVLQRTKSQIGKQNVIQTSHLEKRSRVITANLFITPVTQKNICCKMKNNLGQTLTFDITHVVLKKNLK